MDLSRNKLIGVILGVITLLYFLIWFFVEPVSILGAQIEWQNVWLAVSIGYLLASVRVWDPIQPDEMGVRIVLGVATDELTSGPPFAPPGLVVIETTEKTIDQREFPGEPNDLHRSKDGDPDNPPEGKVPPLRVTFGEKPLTEEDAKRIFGEFFTVWPQGTTAFTTENLISFDASVSDTDGLAKARITAEVAHVARLRVWKLKSLIEKIPADVKTGRRIDEVFRQIEDEQVTVINTILTKITVAQALRNLAWVNAVMFQKVARRIQSVITTYANNNHSDGHSEEWGIDLEGAFIKAITFNRALNSSITNAGQSIFDATALANLAEGKKIDLIRQGEGVAQAAGDLEQKTLEGRAAGLEAIKKLASSEAGRAAIGSEVAREIGQNGNTIVVGTDGVTQILGIAAAAAKGTKGDDKK